MKDFPRKVQNILNRLGFIKTYYVYGRASVADLFRPKSRCGIYILHFQNGEHYIGQSVDVTRRFTQHKINHNDIWQISFKKIRKSQLDLEEERLVGIFEEKAFRLRNILLVSEVLHGESDFDLIRSEADQVIWKQNLKLVDLKGARVDDPGLRRRYSKKCERFKTLPYYDEVIQVLRQYIQKGIPAILDGEISFWSCSCLPGYSNPGVKIYSRINVFWQEVFTALTEDGTPWFSFHMAKTPLQNEFGNAMTGVRKRFPGVEVDNHKYTPGGSDQVNIHIKGSEPTIYFMNDPAVAAAIRTFNLRLMKKGPCVYSRYHCLDLADHLVIEQGE